MQLKQEFELWASLDMRKHLQPHSLRSRIIKHSLTMENWDWKKTEQPIISVVFIYIWIINFKNLLKVIKQNSGKIMYLCKHTVGP